MRVRSLAFLVILALVTLGACNQETPTTQPADDVPVEEDGTGEEDPQADQAAQARRYEGQWSGMWTNRTFGSTGSASATVVVGADGETMTITLDLGGSVFGASDPPAEEFVMQLEDSSARTSGTSATYGPYEVTLDLEAETISITLSDVPGERITTVTASGSFSESSFSADFTINFSDGSTAQSTLELTKS